MAPFLSMAYELGAGCSPVVLRITFGSPLFPALQRVVRLPLPNPAMDAGAWRSLR